MYAHLVRHAGEVCVHKGRRIRARLEADPRLGDAAAELAAAQDSLETKLTLWQNAVEDARTAQAVRDESCRALQDRLREFGLNVLSVTRNHHDADLFLRYFPDGYGRAIHGKPPELAILAEITLGKLAEETDPWLVCFRGRIATALDEFAMVRDACDEAVGARHEAFEYLVAEKLRWIQGLSRSRLKAQAACLSDWPYVRSLFLPASEPHQVRTVPADASSTEPYRTAAHGSAGVDPQARAGNGARANTRGDDGWTFLPSIRSAPSPRRCRARRHRVRRSPAPCSPWGRSTFSPRITGRISGPSGAPWRSSPISWTATSTRPAPTYSRGTRSTRSNRIARPSNWTPGRRRLVASSRTTLCS